MHACIHTSIIVLLYNFLKHEGQLTLFALHTYKTFAGLTCVYLL